MDNRLRYKRDDVYHARGVGIKNLMDRIESDATPVHPAAAEWEQDSALGRRGREKPVVPRMRYFVATGLSTNQTEYVVKTKCVVGRNALGHERRHVGRKRLRRREALAVSSLLRH